MKGRIGTFLFFAGLQIFLLMGAATNNTSAEGFAGLGTDARDYEQVIPGKVITFPQDHGPHPDFKIEWWYVTANLEDASGNQYGIQWTLFRQAREPSPQKKEWNNQQIWMAHAAVTTKNKHYVRELFARGGIGQANVEASPFHAWIDNWEMKSAKPGQMEPLTALNLTANGKDFAYDLSLLSAGPLIRQGDKGYSLKSDEGQASYYYSAPFLNISGTLKLDGKDVEVMGSAWIDREWSSQPLSPDQTGWDWFSLHLDNGEKIMLFRLRYGDGRTYYSGNWMTPSGESQFLSNKDIKFTREENTEIGGRSIPTKWTLAIEKKNFKIKTAPLNPQSWMNTRFSYWEGPIIFNGSHQGVGYLEMTGY